MIKCLDSGDLYCSECGRLCDKTCFERCDEYKGACGTCKHWDNDEYCEDCSWFNNKWEDRYVHTGKF